MIMIIIIIIIEKVLRDANYSNQKHHKQQKLQKNNKKAERTTITRKQNGGRKAIMWIFQATNKRNLTLDNSDLAKNFKKFLYRESTNNFRLFHYL